MGLRINPNLGSAVSVAVMNGYNNSEKRYIEEEQIFLPGAHLPANLSPRLYKNYVNGDPHLNRIFVEEDNGIEHQMPEDDQQLAALTSNPQTVTPVAPVETVASPVPTQENMAQQVPVSLEQVQQQTPQIPQTQVQETQQESNDPYTSEEWTKAALQQELENRSLPTTGNKDELVARLVEDDASRTQSNPENPFTQS